MFAPRQGFEKQADWPHQGPLLSLLASSELNPLYLPLFLPGGSGILMQGGKAYNPGTQELETGGWKH